MVGVLEEWLGESAKLELNSMDILPAEVVSGSGESGGLYKHGLRVELIGTYLDTLEHLQSLENLEYHFLWDELIYEVTTWPEAKVSLQIYTVSKEESWIGV